MSPGAEPDAGPFSAAEHRRRWRAFQELLRRREVDVAVLTQSRNVLYLAGIAAHGHVLVPAEGDPVFLVQIDHARARQVSALPAVEPSRGWSTVVEALGDLGHAGGTVGGSAGGSAGGTIGVEKDALPVSTFERLAARLPRASWADVGPDLLAQRQVKSDEEIACLRRAAAISDTLFEQLRTLLRPGVSEVDLHGQLALAQRRLGADGLSSKHGFNDRTIEHGWVVSGPNTAQVSGYWLTMTGLGPSPARPYGPTLRQVQPGDLVCYDVGTSVHGYHSDHARTLVLGPASAEQRRLWEAVCHVQDAAVAEARPGRTAADVYAAAAAAADRLGIADHFMTQAVLPFPYVGHGVGLEIDEPPLLSPRTTTPLRAGMVLAIEPKVIVPGWGGLTVEDTVLVTDDGPEVLTTAGRELEVPLG